MSIEDFDYLPCAVCHGEFHELDLDEDGVCYLCKDEPR